MKTSEPSECISKLLKYPPTDNPQALINLALELKKKFLSAKDDPLAKTPAPEPYPTTVKKSNSDWMSESRNFFSNDAKKIKLPPEDKKTVKVISNDVKPVKKTVLEKVALCIDKISIQSKKYKANPISS